MSPISNKPINSHSVASVLVRLGARKVAKKRACSKRYKQVWLNLKTSLAKTQTYLDEAIDAGDEVTVEKWSELQYEVLTKMRTFTDYKFTNTGKKYGKAECLGCDTGVDASDAHTCS